MSTDYDAAASRLAELEDALLAVDHERTRATITVLVATLGEYGVEAIDLAAEIAVELIDAWIEAAERCDDPTADPGCRLIVDTLAEIGEAYPGPIFAGAHEQLGLRCLVEERPLEAVDHFTRAIELTDDDQERLSYQEGLAQAYAAVGDAVAAAEWAELVLERTDDDSVREDCLALAVRARSEFDPAGAAERALTVLHVDAQVSAAVGEAAMWAFMAEATRLENDDEPPGADLCLGLRAGLDHPEWIPEPFSISDWSVFVAWMDVLRDDLRRLEPTLALATGPFVDVELDARAALLRVLVGFARRDTSGMEVALRQAWPAVERAANPVIERLFRRLVAELAATRGGSLPSPGSDLGIFAEDRLFHDCLAALLRARNGDLEPFGPELREQLDQWCEQQASSPTDPMVASVLWMSAMAAAAQVDRFAAVTERYEGMARTTASVPPDSAQAGWLEPFLAMVSTAMTSREDPSKAVSLARAASEEARRTGDELLGFLADLQLAIRSTVEPRERFAATARALAYRMKQTTALPGSSERLAALAFEQDLVTRSLQAADRLKDPRLAAELLEFLRAQELPEPGGGSPETMPFGLLAPDNEAAMPSLAAEDALRLKPARPVLMPWGRVALAEFVPPPDDLDPVPLTVPRLPDGDSR